MFSLAVLIVSNQLSISVFLKHFIVIFLDTGQSIECLFDLFNPSCFMDPFLDHGLLASVVVPVHFFVKHH